MASQQTLKSAVHCTGVGVHGNSNVRMELHPAPPGTGIVFCRTDQPAGARRSVRAISANAIDAKLCTAIGNGRVSVRTIEHLMAAFAGCDIDNAVVKLDGAEVPIMDGSAEPFVDLIESAGIVEQGAPRRVIEMLRTVRVGEGDRWISASRAESFSLHCNIDFDHAEIGRQSFVFDPSRTCFSKDVARARTFCRECDVKDIREAGMGRGGSLKNTLVFGGDGPINEGGLRYPDECARHKALDAIGDLYLAGAPILGKIECSRSGHGLHRKFLSALLRDTDAWRVVGAGDEPVAAMV